MVKRSPGSSLSLPRPPWWINRNFLFLWVGQTISLLGDTIFDLTLVVWVATTFIHYSWTPLAVSGILAFATVPILFVGPLAGVLVDRWDKRQTMLWMDILRLLLVMLLLLITVLASAFSVAEKSFLLLLSMYATVFCIAVCSQFFSPARLIILGDIVEEAQQTNATGMQQTTQSVVTILGPPLAAPLLFGFGIQWALLINAASFGFSFLAILAIRIRTNAPHGPLDQTLQSRNIREEFLQGIRFTFHHPVLRTLLIGVFFTALGAGAINALMVFFLAENLHTSVTLIGILDTVYGVGIIGGALFTSVVVNRIGLLRVFSLAVICIGGMFILLARTTSLELALVCMAILGVFQGTISVTGGPLILKVTPREFIGRVVSVLNPFATIASLLSITLAGYLASTLLRGLHSTLFGFSIGPIDTIFTFAGLLIILGGSYVLIHRKRE